MDQKTLPDNVYCVVPYEKIFDYGTRISYFIFKDHLNTVYVIKDEHKALEFSNSSIAEWYDKNVLFKWQSGHCSSSIRKHLLGVYKNYQYIVFTK